MKNYLKINFIKLAIIGFAFDILYRVYVHGIQPRIFQFEFYEKLSFNQRDVVAQFHLFFDLGVVVFWSLSSIGFMLLVRDILTSNKLPTQ